ncbi:uncharacterized protein [Littorina saxatilis]
MFSTKTKGRTGLEPMCGRSRPVTPSTGIYWKPQKGDIQDCRNRLGYLCPPTLREIELVAEPKRQGTCGGEKFQLLEHMLKLYNKRSVAHRPYFRDPYGRDLPGGQVQLMINCRNKECPSKHTGTRQFQAIKNPRLRQLQQSMDEAAERREEQRKADTATWGRMAEDSFFAEFTEPPKTRPQETSPHLYKPKSVKLKSEWTTNMEASLAASRKKSMEAIIQRRIEEHNCHGGQIRMNKSLKDAERFGKLVTDLRARDEKSAKAIAKHKKQFI